MAGTTRAGRPAVEGSLSAIHRAAAVALVLALAAAATVTLVGAWVIREAAVEAAESRWVAEAYRNAAQMALIEESLSRQYRLEPGPQVRARQGDVAADLRESMRRIRDGGGPADRAMADDVVALHESYLAANAALFDAVDAGHSRSDQIVLASKVESTLELASLRLDGADDARRAAADVALNRLNRSTALVLSGIVAAVVLSVALLATVGRLTSHYRRHLIHELRRNRHLARHDALTGLPNRARFTEFLEHAITRTQVTTACLAVMVIDLDRFKEVNDTLGQVAGDEVLQQVGRRLQSHLPQDSILARLGSDEFAVAVITAHHDSGGSQFTELAATLVAELHSTLRIEDVSLRMEASAGIAIAGLHIHGADDLLRAADLALRAAKTTNVNVVVHDPTRHVNEPQRLVLLADLRESLNADHDLTLHYQPKINLLDGRVTGVEALVRWQHPTKGAIPPASFIPAAEGTGLITRLTDHVLDLALRQAQCWLGAGHPLQVAVNLSARCLTDPALPTRIDEALQRHGVPSELLRLEVTESAVMTEPGRAFRILNQLRDLGLALSVDDFGTGYTSMSHLKELTFDELKIDRSFITGITRHPGDQALTRATIELGHAFGLTVVAEGVEHHDQQIALQTAGCDVAQGYLYARPMPAEAVSRWLADRPHPSDVLARPEQTHIHGHTRHLT